MCAIYALYPIQSFLTGNHVAVESFESETRTASPPSDGIHYLIPIFGFIEMKRAEKFCEIITANGNFCVLFDRRQKVSSPKWMTSNHWFEISNLEEQHEWHFFSFVEGRSLPNSTWIKVKISQNNYRYFVAHSFEPLNELCCGSGFLRQLLQIMWQFRL